MKMVKGENLIYEYYLHNEAGEIEHTYRALDNVDIAINPGEFVVILGRNGSGKSTLARHLNALLLPQKGSLWIKGKDTSVKENIWLIRQQAGMVFQNPDNQIIATIVEEDIAFGPENLGTSPDIIRKRVDEALEAVEMKEYAKRSPNMLSGGQKQRVAIAGVLAMRPECIVLDEPTAMLDPSGRIEVMDTIKRLNKEENITIIHITHFMEEAVQADRVIVMDEGRVVLTGTPSEVFSNVIKMKEIGLDVPQVTELAFMLREKGINIDNNILTIEDMVHAICRLK